MLTSDQWGQEFAYYSNTVPPGDSVLFLMSVNTTTYDLRYYLFPDSIGTLNDIPTEIRTQYTADGEYYDIYNPVIQNAVQEAIGTETNLYWKIRNIHDYIISHITYALEGGWDTAPIILTRGTGSCSEYSYLMVSMCRSAGIPARYEAGGNLGNGTTTYVDSVFHRWQQVYIPPYGWVHIDATRDDKTYPANQARYFGGTSKNLFATTLNGGGSNKISWTYNSANSYSGGSMYRTKVVISDTPTTYVETIYNNYTPTSLTVYQNYPNPFNAGTKIRYILPQTDRVTITIYNSLGQIIQYLLYNNLQEAGEHSVIWNGRSLNGIFITSGVYFYRITTGNGLTQTKRMVFIK
jgi:transglutaminase-like putative cysteine protease